MDRERLRVTQREDRARVAPHLCTGRDVADTAAAVPRALSFRPTLPAYQRKQKGSTNLRYISTTTTSAKDLTVEDAGPRCA